MTTTSDYRLSNYLSDRLEHVLLTQWAADSRWLTEPKAASDCRYPVTFVGAAHGDRRRRIESLAERGIDVECFGHGWRRGAVAVEEISEIMHDSVISLNFANSRGENQIKARTFEVPGAGGFLLTGDARGLDRYYRPGREVVIYSDLDDLAAKIRYFLSHSAERDAIARAGYERTLAEHTYEQRLQQVLDFTLESKQKATALAPVPDFDNALAAHRLTPLMKGIRSVLLVVARLFMGNERGRRAARRLIFELSWRLAGRRTFTAAGWPGRLFPHD
jgi:spore maturation protein CgeB